MANKRGKPNGGIYIAASLKNIFKKYALVYKNGRIITEFTICLN